MQLPPYGFSSEQLKSPSNSRPMESWTKGEAEFQNFIDQIGQEIEDSVWPTFNPTSKSWQGLSTKFAEEASRSEIEVCMDQLQGKKILSKIPNSPGTKTTYGSKSHKWHYEVEDFIESRPPGTATQMEMNGSTFPTANYCFYDETADPLSMKSHFISNFRKKYQGTFQLKLRFRRPRPQQVAFINGHYDFQYHQARSYTHTGNHPSLISGHCAQGLLLMGGYLEDKLKNTPLEEMDIEALSQYAADFGDRRVFAGVHYPSDNVCSWIMCLRLAKEVFDDAELIQYMFLKAITEKSHVYRMIVSEYEGFSSLHPLLNFLKENIAKAK